jgi:hypothetical protein
MYDLPPAYRREPRNWKLGALMLACFAGLGAILLFTGVSTPRNVDAPFIPDGDGSYAFSFLQHDGKTPVGYDPCQPIRIEINPDGAPRGHEDLVRTAMDHVSQASGLRFELVGTTDSRRFFDSRASWDRGPSVVGWSTEDEYDELDGDVAGVGGSTMVELAGRRRLTTGAVVLDIEVFEELLRTGRDDDAQAIVDHEFGHLVGLDHVDDRGELMHRENTGRTTWGIGDREGLARLGSIRCG